MINNHLADRLKKQSMLTETLRVDIKEALELLKKLHESTQNIIKMAKNHRKHEEELESAIEDYKLTQEIISKAKASFLPLEIKFEEIHESFFSMGEITDKIAKDLGMLYIQEN